ncbi:hypothetical protein M5585_22910 [Serratia ureilytica]
MLERSSFFDVFAVIVAFLLRSMLAVVLLSMLIFIALRGIFKIRLPYL